MRFVSVDRHRLVQTRLYELETLIGTHHNTGTAFPAFPMCPRLSDALRSDALIHRGQNSLGTLKGGWPIQAVFWLEWGSVVADKRTTAGAGAHPSPSTESEWPILCVPSTRRAQNLGGPFFAFLRPCSGFRQRAQTPAGRLNFAKSGIPDSIPLETCLFPVPCESKQLEVVGVPHSSQNQA